MSDARLRLTGNDQGWFHKGWWKGQHWQDQATDTDEEEEEEENQAEQETRELAPCGSMSMGADRSESPSLQDVRLLHDLVDDLTREQEQEDKENARCRVDQVRKKNYIQFLFIK